MTYKDFEDFLNEKFYKENPMTLDDEWPDLFSDWVADLDIQDVIKWADEFASVRVIKALEDLQRKYFKVEDSPK